MKEYHVVKKYADADEDEGFYVEKVTAGNKDITKKIDKETLFEDDDDLVEYLAEVFDQDPDDIEVIEDELKVEFQGNSDKLDPDGAGMIQN
jgi:peptide subunit release factor 1 (eRF1)